ncbi:MAG: ABC transporter permease [Terriglobia bacterium]|nr:ABC transporter permease [Terriglobia bacterium]
MKKLRVFLVRFFGLFPSRSRQCEFNEELQSHLQMHIDDNLRAGMTPEEARRDAMLKLGGTEQTTQAYRERGTIPSIEKFLQDIRFAVRQLTRYPGFTITAILMLSLGMGASIAIFSFVDATLLKPLPYRDPNRLVDVTESASVFPRANLSYLDYLDWKRLNHVFSSMDIYTGRGFMMKAGNAVDLVSGARVTDGFFRTLGVKPVLGRDFYAGEDKPDAPNTVILSYGAWQRRFGGRADVIGKTVVLSDTATTIVGVLPRNFYFPPRGDAEFWVPLRPGGLCETRRSCHNLYGIARLREGISVAAARANMKAIARQLELQYPDSNRDQGAVVQPLYELIVGDVRPILLVLLAGSGLLQLIAGVNVVSLLLVRFEARRREVAVRGALGASVSRLIRQFITEAFVLVAVSLAAGLAAAYLAMRVLIGMLSEDILFSMPYLRDVGMTVHVLLYAVGVALLSWLMFSIAPAMRLSVTEMRADLNEGSRAASNTMWKRFGSNLVVVELALAMVLLVGAGLLTRSLYNLLNVDLEFEPQHLATLTVSASDEKYGKNEQQVAFAHEIERRVQRLPGVLSVAIGSRLPVSGNGNTSWIRIVGMPYNGEHHETNEREVSAGYFRTIKAPLLRGREFTETDDASHPNVVIVNEAFVRKFLPGQDPIGKKIGDTTLTPKSLREIVGVVADIREASLDGEIMPAEYLPFDQSPENYLSVIVRSSQSEASLLPSIVSTIRQIDPGVGTLDETTMMQRINDSPTAYLHRSAAYLIGGFAALALLLGIIGLYGVIAYSVGRRTREIGVRMALGAQRSSVYQLILKEAGRLAAMGIILGIVSSIVAATLLRKLLFQVHAWDLGTLSVVVLVLAVAVILASYLPARRAASLNPMDALRTE